MFETTKRKNAYKKAIEYLKNADYTALLQASNEVQDYCINEKHETEKYTLYSHHLPLKNDSESSYNDENWDLSDEDKGKIMERVAKLETYASALYYASHYDENGEYDRSGKAPVQEVLPPFVVFPLYDGRTIGWRMGLGEEYMDIFLNYIYSLDDKQRRAYFLKYPVPDYMKTNMFTLNIVNYHLRRE